MRFPIRLLTLPLIIGIAKPALSSAQTNSASPEGVPVSVRWNRLVPALVDQATASRRAARAAAAAAKDSAALRRIAQAPQPLLLTVYTLLSMAQYGAVNSSKDNKVSSDLAVANVSATVLREMYTDSTVRALIARELARDVERSGTGSRERERARAAKNVGEDVARRVIAWAPKLSLVGAWNGTIPKGPGMWYSAPGIPPIGITVGSGRAWLLDSTSQFRPGPPPAFGSAEWQAAIEEVRRVARERTHEQTAIAQRWNSGDPWGVWNEKASDAIRRNRMSDAEGARVLAVLNIAASDAVIACFEAKYHYWTIRPSQADSTIALADSVQLPNFPSYPSGHACSAGAFGTVLAHYFPSERGEFTKISEEQAMSRLYGGIHYRFDNDDGLALGRVVAQYVIDRERRGGLNAWRTAATAR